MQPGYTLLNILLLWVNTWSTFKTLNRRSIAVKGQRSSRFLQKNKREMKTCLSVWVVWVSWKMLERVIDSTIGMVTPFLHEMKCLFLLLLIITRPWGTEPLVLNVLRPAIKPYTGIIDASLYWLELGGDFLFLIVCLPFQALNSWWWDSPASQSGEKNLVEFPDNSILAINIQEDPPETIPTPPSKPEATPVIQPVAEAARAAIEEHRKEQEQQAEEEAKLRELREQVAKDKAVHLYRVQKPPLPLPPRSNFTSRASQILPKQQAASKSTSDLPASALNLPIKSSANSSTTSLRPTLARPAVIPPQRPVVPNPNGESSSSSDEPVRPSIYPTSALAMPMPVRAARAPVRPAIHVNANVGIQRPSNPIPSVTIPLATQTVGRMPRSRPLRSTPPPGLESRSLGPRSADTFVTTSSMATVPADEFGISRNHRREPADDETVSGTSQQTVRSGSGTTTTNEGGGSGGKQNWEDFMASLERQNQAAMLPRGTSDPHLNGNSHLNNEKTGNVDIIATRGNREAMKRIAGLKKEVDEKLKRINEASGPQKGKTAAAKQDTAGLVSTRVKALDEMQVDVPHGQKRPRKAVDHAPALIASDESSGEADGKPELKRKRKELVTEAGADDATIVSSNTKSSRSPVRPTRTTTIKTKEKPIVAPAVTRAKTTRSAAKRPTEVVIPGTAMRTRSRRGGAS